MRSEYNQGQEELKEMQEKLLELASELDQYHDKNLELENEVEALTTTNKKLITAKEEAFLQRDKIETQLKDFVNMEKE